jgi:hypothetical protein
MEPMKKNLLIAIMLIAFTAISVDAFRTLAQPAQIAGGYGEASKTDPEVVSAARFAIKQEQRKLGRRLSLISIERAEVQVVAGLNYRLCLKVKVKGKTQDVTAVVYKNLKQKYSLSRWDAGRCKVSQ